ncbi:hypothetical protein LTS06_009407 [Exophiala xenobiotica]|nr:hypothetical protein LTS06_009407 [Exophiala xenobiotica]
MPETADLPTGSSSMESKHNAPDALHKPQVPSQDEDDEYPPLSTVIITVAALMLTSLCVSLDRTIIATAIPVITDHFDSLGDVGWYASAYLLTMSAFMLFMGRVYKFYNPKWVYISCVGVFELGSLVCGVAPNSTALIVGRAIAGLGSAGVMSGAITIVVYLVPLQKRPAYTGTLGGAIFVSVANNIFDNKLAKGLAGIPGLNADLVAHVGATDLRDVVAHEYLHSVLVVYNDALRNAFYVCAALAAATIVGAVFMPWKSLKKAAAEQQAQAKADREHEKNERESVSGRAGTDARVDEGTAAQEQKALEV